MAKKRTNADRASDAINVFKGEISYWILQHFAQHGATFERMLEWREKNIFKNIRWIKLQQWAKSEISQAFDFAMGKVDTMLISTSVFKGKRVMHGDPLLDNAFEVHQEEKTLEAAGKAIGCWCYAFCDTKNDNALVLIPYREEDRKKELESGRLTQDLLDRLWNHHELIQLVGGTVYNGKPCLTLNIQVPVENGKVLIPPDCQVSLLVGKMVFMNAEQ